MEIVTHVRKEGSLRPELADKFNCLLDRRMRGMRPMPERIQKQHIQSPQLFLRLRWDFAVIGQIRRRSEFETIHRALSVDHADGRKLDTEKLKRRSLHSTQIELRHHRLDLFVKGVAEHALQRCQSIFGPIYGDRFPLPEIEIAGK